MGHSCYKALDCGEFELLSGLAEHAKKASHKTYSWVQVQYFAHSYALVAGVNKFAGQSRAYEIGPSLSDRIDRDINVLRAGPSR